MKPITIRNIKELCEIYKIRLVEFIKNDGSITLMVNTGKNCFSSVLVMHYDIDGKIIEAISLSHYPNSFKEIGLSSNDVISSKSNNQTGAFSDDLIEKIGKYICVKNV